MKKICSIMVGLAMIGIVSFGLNSSVETLQSAHGDYPAPAYNKGKEI
ncbi:Phr family secreted Rap phosphatase inhibitor [Bacillus sp. JJ1127]